MKFTKFGNIAGGVAITLAMTVLAGCTGAATGTAVEPAGKTAALVQKSKTASAVKADETAAVVQEFLGQASWYGPKFHGRTTASGEPFDMHELTAAHRTLPFGTRVRVTNPQNGRSVVVRINDRGPFAGKRVIDLSRKAAEMIGLRNRGVGRVKIEVLDSA